MVIWGVDFFSRRRDGELGRLREAMNEARTVRLTQDDFAKLPTPARIEYARRWPQSECEYVAPEGDSA